MFETKARARNTGGKMHCIASSYRFHDLKVEVEADIMHNAGTSR